MRWTADDELMDARQSRSKHTKMTSGVGQCRLWQIAGDGSYIACNEMRWCYLQNRLKLNYVIVRSKDVHFCYTKYKPSICISDFNAHYFLLP